MSRKRQTIIYILLIFFLTFFYMRTMERFFTPEGVFHAYERGLRYGPSEEIFLKHKAEGNKVVIVGRIGDGLSIVTAERKMFSLWGLGAGETGYREPYERADVMVLYHSDGLVLGRVYDPEVVFVNVYGYGENPREAYFEVEAAVKDGFFCKEVEKLSDDDLYPRDFKVYGKDSEGKELGILKSYFY